MGILERLSDPSEWERYVCHKKTQGNLYKSDEEDLLRFTENREYLPVVKSILDGGTFAPPVKILVNKSKVGRKRAVYTFDRAENYVLKIITFMLRDYDHLFAPNLYSFRKERGVKSAVHGILSLRDLDRRYVYKVDISNYFNSVDTDILLPELKDALGNDPALYCFLERLLSDPRVMYGGELISEKKGIMAGVPVSTFLANLYLRRLDFSFVEKGIPYARYSDDIIVFAKDAAELEWCIQKIRDTLAERRLSVNPEKETITNPGEKWTFLGFSYCRGTVDVCDVSVCKLKAKMRRKSRALLRWADKKGVDGTRAARAFVKRFNAKLYDNKADGELTWARWYFPVINTDTALREIDSYMQDCVRYIATGKRNKGRYNFTYDDIKSLGYRSLVNEYYKMKDTDT